jgi:hypothetical protein
MVDLKARAGTLPGPCQLPPASWLTCVLAYAADREDRGDRQVP